MPTKYELVINIKKALGLDVPPTLLATRRRGDRIIELPVSAAILQLTAGCGTFLPFQPR